ncbi:hypothetical protein [Paraburkholderia guartelaensis]|uniref:hypothetical protein n=1 Tax=Paraburkholderia guartelaensis TaxID=2546446 RepID=UPI002AB72012|nr:hypothetical protein [Paraburkholderia guartelaensis]
MSIKTTLARHCAEGDETAWHLYREVFESGVVYLELGGVAIKLRSRDLGGADLVVRLPIATAVQLGVNSVVPTALWESACKGDKESPLRRLRGSVKK